MKSFSKLSSLVPFQAAIGNHDYMDANGENGVPFHHYFPHPSVKETRKTPWYAFEAQSAFFVILSSEHDLSPQISFLKKTLEGVDRKRHRFIIVALHNPFYVEKQKEKHQSKCRKIREAFEPLIMEHKVDVVLAGYV